MNPALLLEARQSEFQDGAPTTTRDRRPTTLVVCDVGCDCAGGIWQALHHDHDLAVLPREPQEPVGVFARRVAERVRRIPSPVVSAFVGPHHWGPAYASLVRSLAGCLPSGATLTLCSGSSSERLRCQATADALAELDHPPIAVRVVDGAQGHARLWASVAASKRAPALCPPRSLDSLDSLQAAPSAAEAAVAQ